MYHNESHLKHFVHCPSGYETIPINPRASPIALEMLSWKPTRGPMAKTICQFYIMTYCYGQAPSYPKRSVQYAFKGAPEERDPKPIPKFQTLNVDCSIPQKLN